MSTNYEKSIIILRQSLKTTKIQSKMKKLLLIAAIAVVTLFTSCDKEETAVLENKVPTALNIRPDIAGASVSTRASISAFPNGAAIGLFVTDGSLGGNYNGISDNANVRSTFNGSVWTQSPAVYLSSANATVYAYYPYSSSNTNGTAIPVEHASQVDYLYGTHSTGQSAVNSSNPNVNLTMHHALTLLQFKMNRSNYTGAGVVTKIEIANASGKTCIFSSGTLNITTGTIAKTTGQNRSASLENTSGLYTIPSFSSDTESPNLRLMLLPVASTPAAGDIQMFFTIDGKVYTWNVPATTAWNSGTKNTYTITLTGTNLIVDNVTITDWTNGTNGSATIQ